MARSSYIIDDEPVPGPALVKYIVDPLYPLLAVMMAGVWLGWPWMLFNARALGSPHWKRQAWLLAIGLAGSTALALIIIALLDAEIITSRIHIRLALLVVTVWKLGISYKVHSLQSGTFSLYTYYHDDTTASFARRLVGLGMVLRIAVLALFNSALWVIIVSVVSGAP